jgi:hypothetical protein
MDKGDLMMSRIKICVLSIVMFFLASSASATLLVDDPCAMPGWADTMYFGSGDLTTEVDYAVFAPGDFTGIDSSAGYVYAYQVFNTSVSGAISMFELGLLNSDVVAMAGSVGTYGGGQVPSIMAIDSFADVYRAFFSPSLPENDYSEVLLLTSLNGPTRTLASVINSGLSDSSDDAPSPIPEPASLGLMSLGAIALLRRKTS